ncbi:methyltransferase (plasmid) [Gemmatirosa kalamazoonensis]|uniref:Methyltransferase n=1 Tax=Gemmatirosa kalamazoonensis TaxID=861299 RepID=W0RP33_9BACT|nr:L-histidine N(alpha)-methyltransferase [Gemmatirosa kalamazoonensis]AHG92759.1 methyltransferase [Gemmatirosa kalamazoonensis]
MTAPLARPLGDDPVLVEILAGLRGSPKTLPPKLFYDAAGAELFERICELDEYYLTRTELTILRRHVGEIAALAGPRAALVEYGSGAGVKVRLLLDAMEDPAAYVPIDISREQLARVASELAAEYRTVPILPVCADYTAPVVIPDLPQRARRVAFFPGSTIGNFHPPEATAFLRRVRRTLGRDGLLILGVDRRKDAATLHAAYDDAQGVTAAFNRNMLARLNREYGADFDLARFRHRAVWNDEASRVEMHLVSTADQCVHVAGQTFHFARGETLWTESSYKYDRQRLDALASGAGFSVARLWTDEGERFWVAALEVRPDV